MGRRALFVGRRIARALRFQKSVIRVVAFCNVCKFQKFRSQLPESHAHGAWHGGHGARSPRRATARHGRRHGADGRARPWLRILVAQRPRHRATIGCISPHDMQRAMILLRLCAAAARTLRASTRRYRASLAMHAPCCNAPSHKYLICRVSTSTSAQRLHTFTDDQLPCKRPVGSSAQELSAVNTLVCFARRGQAWAAP